MYIYNSHLLWHSPVVFRVYPVAHLSVSHSALFVVVLHLHWSQLAHAINMFISISMSF